MDFGKIFSAIKLPLLILIVISVISIACSIIVFSALDISNPESIIAYNLNPLNSIGIILGFLVLPIIIWTGYRTAKIAGGGALEGAVGALIVGFVVGIINLVNQVAIRPIFLSKLYEAATAAGNPALSMMFASQAMGYLAIIGSIIGFFFALILYAVLGAIGGFIGKKNG